MTISPWADAKHANHVTQTVHVLERGRNRQSPGCLARECLIFFPQEHTADKLYSRGEVQTRGTGVKRIPFRNFCVSRLRYKWRVIIHPTVPHPIFESPLKSLFPTREGGVRSGLFS